MKNRRLKRDIVVSMTNIGDLVGIYFTDTNGKNILGQFSPEKADKIIQLWNNDYYTKQN